MSSFSSALGYRQLAVGAALLGCSLASTDALGQGMTFTTVNSLTVSGTVGTNTFTYTLPGASNGFYYITDTGGIARAVRGWSASSTSDAIAFAINTGSLFYTSASGSGTISLTFSQDVTFLDVSAGFAGVSSGWEYAGSAVNDGDVFLASGSPYVFTIDYSYSGVPANAFFSFAAFSLAAAAPAIPLPGAAGLAACGLLGLTRRRRR